MSSQNPPEHLGPTPHLCADTRACDLPCRGPLLLPLGAHARSHTPPPCSPAQPQAERRARPPCH